MSRSALRAAVLLLAAACSRSSPPASQGDGPSTSGDRAAGNVAASTRGTPSFAGRTIRPRPEPCLPGSPLASPVALTEEGRRALEASKGQRALDCAEEATRIAPRLVAALALRADALTALERLEEARLAYARALAIEPENPYALLGAAELYVRRFSDRRDALEVGLEYALRGARSAQHPPHRDRELAGELLLLAGIAENDLGENRAALGHLDRALTVLPEDPDVFYERGVALFELCRFEDALRAFQRALSLSPSDPWILHQLGLLAERRGDDRAAAQLLGQARQLDPKTFPSELTLDERAFRAEIDRAFAELSLADRRSLARIPIEVRDLPEAADLLAVDPPLSPAILGLFRGPPEDDRCEQRDGPHCRSIVFYRKNLLRFARSPKELTEQVRITLLHELGHLRGEDDQELRDRGLE